MSRVRETEYGNEVDILKIVDSYIAHPIMIDDEGITANEAGKKIVPAGSIIDVNGKIVADDTARFVLLKDTDVTFGPREGAALSQGYVDITKIPVQPTAASAEVMKGIFFVGEDYDYVVA